MEDPPGAGRRGATARDQGRYHAGRRRLRAGQVPGSNVPDVGVTANSWLPGGTLEFLRGHWQVERAITDFASGQSGSFAGLARCDRQAGGDTAALAYHEEGELRFGGHRGPASRSVLLEPGIGTGTAPAYAPGKTDRARAELLQSSFEGGVIQSGQTLEGFVYFRQLPAHADRLTLQVGVRPAPDHAPATVLQIPYTTRG